MIIPITLRLPGLQPSRTLLFSLLSDNNASMTSHRTATGVPSRDTVRDIMQELATRLANTDAPLLPAPFKCPSGHDP